MEYLQKFNLFSLNQPKRPHPKHYTLPPPTPRLCAPWPPSWSSWAGQSDGWMFQLTCDVICHLCGKIMEPYQARDFPTQSPCCLLCPSTTQEFQTSLIASPIMYPSVTPFTTSITRQAFHQSGCLAITSSTATPLLSLDNASCHSLANHHSSTARWVNNLYPFPPASPSPWPGTRCQPPAGTCSCWEQPSQQTLSTPVRGRILCLPSFSGAAPWCLCQASSSLSSHISSLKLCPPPPLSIPSSQASSATAPPPLLTNAWDQEHHHLKLLHGDILALHSLSPQSKIADSFRYSLLVYQKDDQWLNKMVKVIIFAIGWWQEVQSLQALLHQVLCCQGQDSLVSNLQHHHHTAEVTSYMYLLVAEKASTITMFPDILLERWHSHLLGHARVRAAREAKIFRLSSQCDFELGSLVFSSNKSFAFVELFHKTFISARNNF